MQVSELPGVWALQLGHAWGVTVQELQSSSGSRHPHEPLSPPYRTTKAAFALRDSQMTDIQKQVREDVTRFRWGTRAHRKRKRGRNALPPMKPLPRPFLSSPAMVVFCAR